MSLFRPIFQGAFRHFCMENYDQKIAKNGYFKIVQSKEVLLPPPHLKPPLAEEFFFQFKKRKKSNYGNLIAPNCLWLNNNIVNSFLTFEHKKKEIFGYFKSEPETTGVAWYEQFCFNVFQQNSSVKFRVKIT